MPDITTGRSENELPALGICFEEYAYPHPVRFVPVQNDLQASERRITSSRSATTRNRTTLPNSATSSGSPRRPHATSLTPDAWLSRNAGTSRTSSIQLSFSTRSYRSWRADRTPSASDRPHTKGRRSMFTYPEAPASSEGSVEIGSPPYFHRSDCNICRRQDGLKTGSEFLDAPRLGGYKFESS